MTSIEDFEISPIALDGSISADWLAMTLAEDARIEGGRLANAEYLAVKIATVSDEILARAVRAERERDNARDDGIKAAAEVARDYWLAVVSGHGHVPTDPFDAMTQAAQEIETAMLWMTSEANIPRSSKSPS